MCQFYQQDLFFSKITSALLAHPKSKKQSWITEGFQLVDGLLYYKGCLYVPPHKGIKHQILSETHDIPIAAHPMYIKMFNILCKSFWWHGMKRDILAYVTRFLSWQCIKAKRIRYPGKLHPHDIPQMKWENISMDFVTGLPTSKGYDSIFVVFDMLTKVAHLFPIKKDSTAKVVAQVFMHGIFLHHGLPRRIISNRDSKFTSTFGRQSLKQHVPNFLLAQLIILKQMAKWSI